MGLAVTLPILAWMGVVRPYLSAMDDVKDRIELERELLVREMALIERGPLLPEAIREAEVRAGQFEGRMLRASSGVLAEAELTRLLEAAALESRVLLEQIRSGDMDRGEEPPPGLSLVRLHVSGESDLEGIMAFLAAMERSHVLLRIRGLALEPETARPGGNGQEEARSAEPTGVVKVQVIVDGFARLNEEGQGGADVLPESNPWRS
jgi:hypothetical protein